MADARRWEKDRNGDDAGVTGDPRPATGWLGDAAAFSFGTSGRYIVSIPRPPRATRYFSTRSFPIQDTVSSSMHLRGESILPRSCLARGTQPSHEQPARIQSSYAVSHPAGARLGLWVARNTTCRVTVL
jgi:hypothetical protein